MLLLSELLSHYIKLWNILFLSPSYAPYVPSHKHKYADHQAPKFITPAYTIDPDTHTKSNSNELYKAVRAAARDEFEHKLFYNLTGVFFYPDKASYSLPIRSRAKPLLYSPLQIMPSFTSLRNLEICVTHAFSLSFSHIDKGTALDTILFETNELALIQSKESNGLYEIALSYTPSILGPFELRLILKLNNSEGVVYLIKGNAINNKYDLFPIVVVQPSFNIHPVQQPYSVAVSNHNLLEPIIISKIEYIGDQSDILTKPNTPLSISPQSTLDVIVLLTPPTSSQCLASLQIRVNSTVLCVPILIKRTDNIIYPLQERFYFGAQYLKYRKPISLPIFLNGSMHLKWAKMLYAEIKQSANCAKFVPTLEYNVNIIITDKILIGYLQFIYDQYGVCDGIFNYVLSDDKGVSYQHTAPFSGANLADNESPLEAIVEKVNRNANTLSILLVIKDRQYYSCNVIKALGAKARIVKQFYNFNNESIIQLDYEITDEIHYVEVYFSLFYCAQFYILPAIIPIKESILCTAQLQLYYSSPYSFQNCNQLVHILEFMGTRNVINLCIHNFLKEEYSILEKPIISCTECFINCTMSEISGEYIFYRKGTTSMTQNQKVCMECRLSTPSVLANAYVVQFLNDTRKVAFHSALSRYGFTLSFIGEQNVQDDATESADTNSVVNVNSTYPYNIKILKYWTSTQLLSLVLKEEEIYANSITQVGRVEVNYTSTPYYLYYVQQAILSTLSYMDIVKATKRLTECRYIVGTINFKTQVGDFQADIHADMQTANLLLPLDVVTGMSDAYERINMSILNPTPYTISGNIFMICEDAKSYEQLSSIAHQYCQCSNPSACSNADCLKPLHKSSCADGMIQIHNSSYINLLPNTISTIGFISYKTDSPGKHSASLIFVNNYTYISVAPLTISTGLPKFVILYSTCVTSNKTHNATNQGMLELEISALEFSGGNEYDCVYSYLMQNLSPSTIKIYRYRIGKLGSSAYGVTVKGKKDTVDANGLFAIMVSFHDDRTLLKGQYNIYIDTSMGTITFELHIKIEGEFSEINCYGIVSSLLLALGTGIITFTSFYNFMRKVGKSGSTYNGLYVKMNDAIDIQLLKRQLELIKCRVKECTIYGNSLVKQNQAKPIETIAEKLTANEIDSVEKHSKEERIEKEATMQCIDKTEINNKEISNPINKHAQLENTLEGQLNQENNKSYAKDMQYEQPKLNIVEQSHEENIPPMTEQSHPIEHTSIKEQVPIIVEQITETNNHTDYAPYTSKACQTPINALQQNAEQKSEFKLPHAISQEEQNTPIMKAKSPVSGANLKEVVESNEYDEIKADDMSIASEGNIVIPSNDDSTKKEDNNEMYKAFDQMCQIFGGNAAKNVNKFSPLKELTE